MTNTTELIKLLELASECAAGCEQLRGLLDAAHDKLQVLERAEQAARRDDLSPDAQLVLLTTLLVLQPTAGETGKENDDETQAR